MRRWWIVLSALALTGTAHAFCGFYVAGADTELFNEATMVVMMRHGTTTVLSMQNDYKGPPEDFAMVVPVPVVLQKENVNTIAHELFDKIDTLSAPRRLCARIVISCLAAASSCRLRRTVRAPRVG